MDPSERRRGQDLQVVQDFQVNRDPAVQMALQDSLEWQVCLEQMQLTVLVLQELASWAVQELSPQLR
ncbi:unnamed protein product [Nippostrongylus brasiliensis]|uniref:Zinc finger protein 212 n=1 Tax=Nippostrongylus brasiliensis TaxID=27835 RepID=A0A0N4XRF5_NIPBR|nr:unnamed protein product [Nippostrongylus brasiliensis]